MSLVQTAGDAEPKTLAGFDAIIDARSPSEFAEDHIPGALNLPVLSDSERAEVGTLYVQTSRFLARRVGAAYVAANVSRHLATAMGDWPGSHRVLVYCWRGGMRSNAMAVILAQVGWRTSVLQGGYKTYRRRVCARLYNGAPLPRVVVLDGPTGSGKTEVLGRLAARGVQALDLEGLAVHRGSLFGGLPGRPQPSQKLFESRLLTALDQLDSGRPVVVEAESSKVGELMVPPVLWEAMTSAPRIALDAPPPLRADYLARAYADLARDPARLADGLARLPDRLGRKRLDDWRRLAQEGAFADLALALIEAHYDPAYRRSAPAAQRPPLKTLDLARLDTEGFDAAAAEIARALEDIGNPSPSRGEGQGWGCSR